jgi:hypothetical protein
MKTLSVILATISIASLVFIILTFTIMSGLYDDYRIIAGLIFTAGIGLLIKLRKWERKKFDVIELKPAFILFAAGIFSAVLASHIQGTDLFKYIVLFVAVIYLLAGWHLFRDYYPGAGNPLLFFTGYAYASIFCGFALSLFSWPFYKLLLNIGLGWSGILILIFMKNWKKIPEKGVVQLLSEILVMIIMTFYQLFRVTHLPG